MAKVSIIGIFSITNQHKCSQTTTGATYWCHFTPQISKYFAGWRTMQAVLCIVHCNKVSKPVKGNLLLCMKHYVSPTNLIYFSHVLKSFKSLNIEN